MIDYKKLYLKYKTKYIGAKKKYGGNTDENEIEKLYKNEMKKLVNLKNKYKKKFNKGLNEKQIFNFLKKIQKMSEAIEKKGYSLNQQKMYIENKYPNMDYLNNNNLNDILLYQIIREYLNRMNNNSISELVKYLEIKIPLKNDELSKYNKGELLGEGAFGAVYKLPKNKVLKVINATKYKIPTKKNIQEQREGIDQIVNEIRSMKRMNKIDPPISPKIYDYWMSNNNNSLHIYIVMEFKGKSLSTWLQERNRDLTETEEQIIEEKIERMHKMGIVHNDLHLDNILVEEVNGEVNFYIADFGLSKTKESLFDTMKIVDYTYWKVMFAKYDILSRYLKLIVQILDIKIIKK